MTDVAAMTDRGTREDLMADMIESSDKRNLMRKNIIDAIEGTDTSIPRPTTPVKKIILVSPFTEIRLGIRYRHVYHHKEAPKNKFAIPIAAETLQEFSSYAVVVVLGHTFRAV